MKNNNVFNRRLGLLGPSLCFLVFMNFGYCDKEEMLNGKWKYTSGHYVGDVLDFSKRTSYRLDDKFKIYKNDSLVGEIVDCKERLWGNNQITIKSKGGKKGVYTWF